MTATAARAASLPARFTAKCRFVEGGCWEWTASKTAGGYGRYSVGYATFLAHRYAYQVVVGPIPGGLQLDHLCRNRACVNPAHLEPVTARQNTLRGQSPASLNSTKTHCQRGHALVEGNIYHKLSNGRPCRQCRQCVFEDTRARRAKLKASGCSVRGRPYRYAAYLTK